MTKKPQTRDELLLEVQDQILFLVKSCNEFDNGHLAEAKRMSATLRLLLHDHKQSKSLLGQLGYKTTFFDTSLKTPTEENTLPIQTSELSLISWLFNNPTHTYKPNFSSNTNQTKIDFLVWWKQTVIKIIGGKEFSRERIIMTIADQDGGAHVDPTVEEDYYDLTRLNPLQHFSMNIDPNVGLPKEIKLSELQPMSSPQATYYTIRQIAHEVLISKIGQTNSSLKLETIYPFDENLYHGMNIGQIGLH